MKFIKLSFLLFFSILISQVDAQQLGGINTTQKSVKKILKEIKKGKAYLIDVRTPEEFSSRHLKFA